MRQYLFHLLILVLSFGYIGLTDTPAQDSKIPLDWKKVSACNISFFVPKDFWKNNGRPFDSCVASFGNKKFSLGLDYGWYSSPSIKTDGCFDYKEEFIEIDGKTAKLEICRFSSTENLNYIARIYVLVNEDMGFRTSLAMFVRAGRVENLETAKQIFQSIRFDK